jgi:ribosomal protein S18 acetylase RimI-like enzyme
MTEFRVVDPSSAEALAILREYYGDIASRFHGREVTAENISAAIEAEPSDDLWGATGLFIVADSTAGCGGLRFMEPGVAELTRIYVAPSGRRRRLGQQIVERLETEARNRGVHTLRLDTRADLVEALALYEKLGYVDVEPFNDAEYAERWLAKQL